MKIIRLLIFLMALSLSSLQAQTDSSKVEWLTMSQAGKKFAEQQRPILIFFYQSDDDSSQMMLNEVFGLQEVADYLNPLFYAVKINAQSTDSIRFFDGSVFVNEGKHPQNIHSFVLQMLGANPQFPSMLIFNKNAEGAVFPAYHSRDDIFSVLVYYAEEIYEAAGTSYEEFLPVYRVAYPPGRKMNITRLNIKWKTFDEVQKLNATQPRKKIIYVMLNTVTKCTVMSLGTFNNEVISAYINKHYYPIQLNALSQDTINIFDTTFVNDNKHKYHDLAVFLALKDQRIEVPTVVFLDENNEFISREQIFLTPRRMEPLIKYFAENFYKDKEFGDYLKTFKSQLPDRQEE